MKEEMLEKKLKSDNLPCHIAIVMDGNGRWAQAKGLPRIAGHKAGIKSVREIVKFCGELKIPILTLYAFSVENWKRPKEEINALMFLLGKYLKKEVNELNKNKVKLECIGRINDLPTSVQEALFKAKEITKDNKGLLLNLALSYGGRTEIVEAVNKIVAIGKKVDEKEFEKYLYTTGLPDPDLLIRTSGEMRISNFLLWQLAYTEIWVTPVYWPDFRRRHLLQALIDYQKRERKFGRIN